MMLVAGLADDLDVPAERQVAFFHHVNVFADRHHFVRRTNDRKNRHVRLRQRREVVHRVFVVGQRLRLGKTVSLQQILPVAG